MRIGIDAMGGDLAPAEQVKGALLARGLLGPRDRIVLIGDERRIRPLLRGPRKWQEYIDIHHAPEVVGMDAPPVESLRAKPESSLAVMAEMHRDGAIDACISAGNTGAFVAAAQMRLRRLRGVHRPGIVIITPTFKGPVALCDVGSNVNCRPQHLHQYAIMAGIYVQTVCGISQPRVGLLSVGQEDAKGNPLVRGTHELLRKDPGINFVGNVEGRDLFRGLTDVVVTDGFTGNVILKLAEGEARELFSWVRDALRADLRSRIGGLLVRPSLRAVAARLDPAEYGAQPLLGVDGHAFIGHGSADARAVTNALRTARRAVEGGLLEHLRSGIAGLGEVELST